MGTSRQILARQAALLTIGLWLATAALFLLPSMLLGVPMSASMLAGVGSTVALGIPVSALIYRVAMRFRDAAPSWRYGVTGAVALAVAIGVTLIDAYKSAWLMHLLNPEMGPERVMFRALGSLAGWVPLFALIAALYLILIHNEQLAARAREVAAAREAASRAALAAAEAERATTAARLEMLRYQLNPHFLFNTLNAISSSVVTGRADAAESMLGKLSDFLRTTLTAPASGMVAIEDELQTLADYLAIEGARLGERLNVEMNCPPELRDVPIPALLLQPLVENAIKHGVGSTSRPVVLLVDVSRDAGHVRICVADDAGGNGRASGVPGTGLGHANVRERLAAIYGAAAALDAAPTEAGYRACVRWPVGG
ncbi:sensor histidine kinase [Sphingomonas colocasiae]|uniref:Histidine kinase n=1 Tax=Sphingomonas colocasiae TaxID=1848973 RepID=A0ABS7PZ85_9SPHN|nr:histidine kinase [Sphingomonas colocasiae]MBY8825299.1 histidine kinase [Sphingomonas colocasiae]